MLHIYIYIYIYIYDISSLRVTESVWQLNIYIEDLWRFWLKAALIDACHFDMKVSLFRRKSNIPMKICTLAFALELKKIMEILRVASVDISIWPLQV